MEELLKSLEKDKSSRYLVGRQDWLELSLTFCHMENGGCFRVTAQNEWDTLNHVYYFGHNLWMAFISGFVNLQHDNVQLFF